MNITSPYQCSFSFEFFPPKDDDLHKQNFIEMLRVYESFTPTFVSITYGASGSVNREKTLRTVELIMKHTSLVPVVHLTCVGALKEEIYDLLDKYWRIGVRYLLVLRGDPRKEEKQYTPCLGGFPSVPELIKAIKNKYNFHISVSSYPEKHPESFSIEEDIEWMQQKILTGAQRAISQFIFSAEVFSSYKKKIELSKITIPILPGLIALDPYKQISSFAGKCRAKIPDHVHDNFISLQDVKDGKESFYYSIEFLKKQIIDLLKMGEQHLHFYTMNRHAIIPEVIESLRQEGWIQAR